MPTIKSEAERCCPITSINTPSSSTKCLRSSSHHARQTQALEQLLTKQPKPASFPATLEHPTQWLAQLPLPGPLPSQTPDPAPSWPSRHPPSPTRGAAPSWPSLRPPSLTLAAALSCKPSISHYAQRRARNISTRPVADPTSRHPASNCSSTSLTRFGLFSFGKS